MSIAVVVGFLALLGIAAETSIVMLVYLHEAMLELKQKALEFNKTHIFHGIYNFSTTFDGIVYLFVVMIMIIYFFKIKKKFNV